MQQSALQGGTCDLDTLGQHEAALELARGDAAMQIDPALVVDLLTTNYELTILDLHRKIRVGESGDRQGNAQPVVAELLDVVGRLPVCRLGDVDRQNVVKGKSLAVSGDPGGGR